MEPFFPLPRNVVHTRVVLLGFEIILTKICRHCQLKRHCCCCFVSQKLRNFNFLRNLMHWCYSITSQYLGPSFQHFVCVHIWQHVFLPVSSTFFQFLPLSSGRNWKKHLFSSFFHSSGKKPISSGSFPTLPTDKPITVTLLVNLQHG